MNHQTNALISLRDLTIADAAHTELVRHLNLDLHAGETLAVVGESGSGKTLTSLALIGLLPGTLRASGQLQLSNTTIDLSQDASVFTQLRGRRISLLMQDPFTSLSPVHTIGAQVGWTIKQFSGNTLSRRALKYDVAEALSSVQLPQRVARQYPHELSGGMRQRAAIAAALAAQPEILIADEPTTALDASTQQGILELLNQLKRQRGLGVILISHDLQLVRGQSDRVIVMYAGSIVEQGLTTEVLQDPVHPYTTGLLAATPQLSHAPTQLPSVPWLASPLGAASGLNFGPGYIPAAESRRLSAPRLRLWGDERFVAAYDDNDLSDARVNILPLPNTTPVQSNSRPIPNDSPALLRLNNVTKRFGNVTALDQVSLTIPRRSSVGIVGESGSGKSTLARIIVGLERPDSGTINLTSNTDSQGRSIQIVFQDPYSSLDPRRSIGHALREALALSGHSTHEATSLLDQVGLGDTPLSARPRDLSGGQRQRVAIARALAADPELLICDESVSALDVSVQAQILNLLAELRLTRNISLLFISHDLAVINQICDSVYVFKDGQIVEHGATHDVFTYPQDTYTQSLLSAIAMTNGALS